MMDLEIKKNVLSKKDFGLLFNTIEGFASSGHSYLLYEASGMIQALALLGLVDQEQAKKLEDEYFHLASDLHFKEEDKIHAFYANKKKNERGAGRKPVLTDEQKTEIEEMREEGYSYRSIAETFGVSHMTIKKALEE